MFKYSLNGAWRLCRPYAGENDYVPAEVPGSVYSDLLRNGLMEDPFYRDNELNALKLMENDFVYSKVFAAPPELLSSDRVLLRCEGLDTIAKVKLNSKLLGCAENMHRTYEFDVTGMLEPSENKLEITFFSPTAYIREQYAKNRADGSSDAMTGFPLIRKAHCMFGWDWGPRLPDAGIWRDITLLGVDCARIENVYVTQTHEKDTVRLNIDTTLSSSGGTLIQTMVTVTSPEGTQWTANGKNCEITIDRPQLWWPNGMGAHPLYTVDVKVLTNGRELDRWTRRIGLRTMTMRTEKDEWGVSFCHNVNGKDMFAMGADYIPEDNIFSRITPERTRALLSDAALANLNVIRVWGGGYYPDDFFYDICDELGLVVWQDMMFACAVYNLTEEFEKNIVAELTDNVRRIRHHASLGLWCGNNEMEMFVAVGEWVSCERQRADYIKMYEYIFPKLLKKEDPQTFYWPASPSSGGSFDKPNDEARGDVHYWDVWHGGKPFTDYRNYKFRYVSEFGFQSFPCLKTIKSFTEPADRNVFSYIMEKHQRNASANSKIISYLAQMYLYPADLDTLTYASQLLQAQAMQYGVEHWRRNRGQCMGAVIWQLNDCWPVASWASIDYFGRWKALHYYAKRFFAPVLISCQEEGVLSQNTNVNAEPFALKKAARLAVSNESLSDFSGIARYQLRAPDASVIKEGSFDVNVSAQTSEWLKELDFSDCDEYGCYLAYQLEENGDIISSGTVLFCPPKHFHFADPQLKAELAGDEIIVKASAYARSVEIIADDDCVFSDNYFDMNAGETRVKILRGAPLAVSARSVFDIK